MLNRRKMAVGGRLAKGTPIAVALAQMSLAAGLGLDSLFDMPAAEWMDAVARRLGRVA